MRRITFNDYAGVSIHGDVELSNPDDRHINRASWLTAMVESGGKFGTVISYDGTGITAGIHQAIAVYPKELRHPDNNALNDQGPLWKLLQRCFQAYPELGSTKDMVQALANDDMFVVNGVARRLSSGEVADGYFIRGKFTGNSSGVMPVRGKMRDQAEMWAALFHTYFSDYNTFSLQLGWGEEKLLKRVERIQLRHAEARKYRKKTPAELFYHFRNPGMAISGVDTALEFDLAMCVWLSYTVNAPAIALKHICKAVPHFTKGGYEEFSQFLIRSLGKSSWGRWAAKEKNGRYQRTRKYAMKIWPKELFVGPNALMPKEL